MARRGRWWGVRETALVLVSIVFTMVAVEGLYRAFRVYKRTFQHHPPYDAAPSFGVYNPPPWKYDAAFGFTYVPGLDWWSANIHEGRFAGCDFRPANNERGNMGTIHGNYEEADLKLLVFGDSFAAMNPAWAGDTWPNLLQRKLEANLGKSVHVVNFGRDSYGVLQMIDLAAARVPEWKPDRVLIAFITNDLIRPRVWRRVVEHEGYTRMIISRVQVETVEPGDSHANEGALVSAQVTRDWCERMAEARRRGDEAALQQDPVVQALVEQYNVIRADNVPQLGPINHWSPLVSFLYNRIRYGYPYHGMQEYEPYWLGGSTEIWDFAADPRFLESIRVLQETGVPFDLIHLPVFPEIRDQQEFVFGIGTDAAQEQALLKSLEKATGRPVIPLLPYMDLPMEDPVQYISSPDDWHPNAAGIEMYSEAVSRALLARDVL